MIDVCHAMNFRTQKTIESRRIALTRSDTSVRSFYWSDFVLAKINSYLTDLDSKYEHVRLRSEAIFTQEINFSMHLSVHAIVIDFPLIDRIENFARIINSYLQNVHNSAKFLLKIQVPGDFTEAEEVYDKYLEFKQLCGHSAGVQLILEFDTDLPDWEHYNKRWVGEKIFGVLLDEQVFLSNNKGFPVLSKKHQEVCKEFMKIQAKFILRSKHPNDSLDQHYQYLCYLFKNHDNLDEEEKLEINYRNYLQSPLQPLADNLESATYETFENDTIKYDLYEESLYKAFLDKKKYGFFIQTKKQLEEIQQKQLQELDVNMQDQQEIVVMYFGAGRGPLIRKALKAADRADVKVRVIALDKNPNAIVTLRNMIIDEKLQDRVELFAGDMRKIQISDMQGDILMSELLGSFGDNELSPECLNPTAKFLRPGGIFVPYSYTNYVVPISSQIIWNEVNIYSSQGLQARVPISQQMYPFELPYVVKIYSATFPCSSKTKEVFTFRHQPFNLSQEELLKDGEGEDQSLKKYDRVNFTVEEEQAEIHGFGGYFTAELYQDVFYSTNPEMHTPGMHSWFPMFFPVKNPFTVYKGQEVSISIWRNNSSSQVWYEWAMSVYDPTLMKQIHTTHIHNINGRGFNIDTANIIEVSKPPKETKHGEDSDDENKPKKNEEEQKYHESIINDVYNSMSDSDEDDEDDEEKTLDKEIQEQSKKKVEESKKQQQHSLSAFPHQVMENMNKVMEKAKTVVQQDIKVDKVKGMFTGAYTKFNDIVQKNKVNLPELHIADLIQEQKTHKSSLNDFLKKSQLATPEKKDLQPKNEELKTPDQSEQQKRKENFKIAEDANSTEQQHHDVDGEEFSDSEETHAQNNSVATEEALKGGAVENLELIEGQKPLTQDDNTVEWLEKLEKGKQVDVTELKLYTVRKQTLEKKSVLYSMVHTYDTRHIALVGGHLFSLQLIQQNTAAQQLKDINTQQIKKMATSFFQKSKEKLWSFRSSGQQSQTSQQQSQQEELKNDSDEGEQHQQPQKKLGLVKSSTQLQRLYMIDIVERGKKEIEVIMHFVNKQYNPMMSPVIKRYRMNLDEQTQDFLVNLEREIQANSQFYNKVSTAFK